MVSSQNTATEKANSSDFRRMMELIHKEKATLQAVSLEVKEGKEHVVMDFLKNHEKIILESEEDDVCGYAWNFQQSCDAEGNSHFSAVTNLSPYFDDIMRLIPDKKKLDAAILKYVQGKSAITEDDLKIVDEFVMLGKHRDSKFSKLRGKYLDILAFAVVRRAHINEVIGKAKSNHSMYQVYEDIVNAVLNKVSSLGKNPVHNYVEYRQVMTLDVTEELLHRSNAQRGRMEKLMQVLAKVSPLEGDIGTDVILKFYSEMAELCSGHIEVLRNCVQLCKDGSFSRDSHSFNENCVYLKNDDKTAPLIEHLEPSIRNAVAHVSYVIDHKTKTVTLKDERRTLEYTYHEISDKTHALRGLITPILLCFERQKYQMLIDLLDSREFRLLLLKIGHQKFAA